jgi:hypothetical protein
MPIMSTTLAAPRVHYNTYLAEDDLPMTMQVGMIARDGIVLASDTAWVEEVIRGPKRYRDVRHASKIKMNGDIAVCYAREMKYAPRVADSILSHWKDSEGSDSQRIRDAISPMMKEVDKYQWECLVAIPKPQKRFVHILNVWATDGVSAPQWQLFVTPTTRYLLTGDDANDARYWLHHYDPLLSVRELQTLAAYLVVDARNFNNAMIDGLEIVCWDGSEFQRVPDDKCLEIEAEARKSADAIRKLVTTPATR